MKKRRSSSRGFTLIELLIVVSIMGFMMALIIPRAMRAQTDNKFNLVRQDASEIAGFIITWAENQAEAQRPGSSFTTKDFLYEDILKSDEAGLTSQRLADNYTGSDNFDGVEKLIAGEKMPQNPFNKVNYFNRVNDDTEVPSAKPGLIYLAARADPSQEDYINFYLIFTGEASGGKASWYSDMTHEDDDGIRRGVFVSRLHGELTPGAAKGDYLLGSPPEE